MRDPFSALKNALHSVFLLEAKRNGKYIYPEIQNLKKILLQSPDTKKKFIDLLKTLRHTLTHLEKWRIDFNSVQAPLSALAKQLNLPAIDWDKYLSQSNTSSKFQFRALHKKNQEIELLTWLAVQAGISEIPSISMQIQMLLEYKEHIGFSQKLSTHLKKDPDFLFRLIVESKKNFILIADTRLILYLTDQQLAKAIIKHLPKLVENSQNRKIQAEKLVKKLNEILSNGRSVSTLLRNAEAKFILDDSLFFRIYQNELNKPPSTSPLSSLEGGLKPTFQK